MGRSNKNSMTEDQTISSMLFITMSIIGLPVDVHVKDGSVYSGIFHTASFDAGFGVVLKQARMTKKGKGLSNFGNEVLVDTLVVLADDLVQVIAKEITLTAGGVGGKITGDCEEAVTLEVCGSENRPVDAEQVNQSRRAGDNNSKEKPVDCRHKLEFNKKNDGKIQSLRSGHEDTCLRQVKADKASDQGSERSTSPDSTCTHSTISEDLKEASNDFPAKFIEKSALRGDRTRNAKEFKLNPAAKVFSPSFVYPNSATPAMPAAPNMVYMPNSCAAANMVYIPNNSPAANMVYMPNSSPAANMVYIPNASPPVPVATIQPEVGFSTFASQPSVPAKISQNGNLTVANAGSGSQFPQPLQYAAHYTPVLSEPAYLQPTSSPAVMVGRPGQLVYVQQVSQDLLHGVSAPFSTRPMLNHTQFPKHQVGAHGQPIPVILPAALLASAQQPFAIQNHIQVLQPAFSASPISVPGPNGFYGK
ncbi:polyadenylate-binding protein-interacting protein [Trifolium repens]|nr:polyadenylate-binding protein-interacting protein [Trifolium repens]